MIRLEEWDLMTPAQKEWYREQALKERRERVATACLQGLLAGVVSEVIPLGSERMPEVLSTSVEAAIEFADALIARLDQ